MSMVLVNGLCCLQILQEMGELRRHVEADLNACQASLDEEAAADAAARTKFGDEWRVPQSATLAKHLWEKLHSYRCKRQQRAAFVNYALGNSENQ